MYFVFQARHQVIKTVTAHSKEVRSVRFVTGDRDLLISTSSDNSAIIWATEGHERLEVKCSLEGHTAAVTVASGLKMGSKLLVATTSNDLTVKIWSINTDSFGKDHLN